MPMVGGSTLALPTFFVFFLCFFPGSSQVLPFRVRIARQVRIWGRLALAQCQVRLVLAKRQVKDRLGKLSVRLAQGQVRIRVSLGLRLGLGCMFIFQLYLLPFYQAFCCPILVAKQTLPSGGKIDPTKPTAFSSCVTITLTLQEVVE